MVYTCLHMLNHHLWGWFSYWLLGLLRVRWSKNNNYPTKNNNRLFPWSFFMLGSQCQNVVPFRTANSQKMRIYLGVQSLSASTSWNHGFYPICSSLFDHVRPIFYMSPKKWKWKMSKSDVPPFLWSFPGACSCWVFQRATPQASANPSWARQSHRLAADHHGFLGAVKMVWLPDIYKRIILMLIIWDHMR